MSFLCSRVEAPMKYDAIIIGSGQAGNPLAYRLADLGWSVALIENKHLRGTCRNTSCRPAAPAIPGLDTGSYLTNESAMQLTALPELLLILGGGYIGLEFGQMFRRYGSRVTVLHTGKQIISREDPETAAELQRALEAEGIQFLLNTRTVRAESKDSTVTLSFESPAGSSTVTG